MRKATKIFLVFTILGLGTVQAKANSCKGFYVGKSYEHNQSGGFLNMETQKNIYTITGIDKSEGALTITVDIVDYNGYLNKGVERHNTTCSKFRSVLQQLDIAP